MTGKSTQFRGKNLNLSLPPATTIRGLLLHKGVTLTQLARRARVSTSMVSLVIHGRKRSARVTRVIQRELGL